MREIKVFFVSPSTAPKRLPQDLHGLRHQYRALTQIGKKEHTCPLRATLAEATRDLNDIRSGHNPEKREGEEEEKSG